MNCKFNCDCSECEMLIPNERVVIIEGSGFNERRRTYRAVKCMRYGQYAADTVSLKNSDILDDVVYLD